MKLENNIHNCALIIEGGGMRASYTSGFVNTLIENQIFFNYVAGVSAGASCSVNYLSRDTVRTKKSFVELVEDKNFGGWGSFLKGEGFFRSEYIYEKIPVPQGAMPYDFKAFSDNPATLKIGAFERDTGNIKYFSRDDMESLGDLMKIVRASSSLPFFMPVTEFKGTHYYDGGLGGGIALDIAQRDGFDKFFVLLSRPLEYYKQPVKNPRLLKAYFRKTPAVYEAMLGRYARYNQTKAALLELEKKGQAYLVFPEQMLVSSRETDLMKLNDNYRLGYDQGKREVERWKHFLGL